MRWSHRVSVCVGCVAFIVSLLGLCVTAPADEPADDAPPAARELILQKGDVVVMLGDSITCQGVYSRFVEMYLVACMPEMDLRVVMLGLSGERSSQFALRMEGDLPATSATVAVTTFGMNDGHFRLYNDAMGQHYRDGLERIIVYADAHHMRMVIGGPSPADTFHHKARVARFGPNGYNPNLKTLSGIARDVAAAHDIPYANTHETCFNIMQAAKAQLGEELAVFGTDGIHPGQNGHFLIAYALLKAIGVDGNIGTITLSATTGHATATEGHTVVEADATHITLESTRYPFCFTTSEVYDWMQGDHPRDLARNILPFVPFNDELNRLLLRVTDLDAPRATVTWGEHSKTFTAAQLEQGINLGAEFLDNPFLANWTAADTLAAQKQQYESGRNHARAKEFPSDFAKLDDEQKANLAEFWKPAAPERLKRHHEIRAALAPVTHTITITPAK